MRQGVRQAAAQIARNPRAAQPLAFQSEKGEFVERVIGAQIIVEFEAIDDAQRVAEPDMLRPQIAMRVDDVAAGRTRGEKRTAAGEEPFLDAIDNADETRRQLRARIEQPAAIVGEALPPVGEMRLSGHAHARGVLIEPRQQRH